MKYLKMVWGWKFRVMMVFILIVAFVSRYSDGLLVALLNAFGVYAIMAIAQGAMMEIKGITE